MNINKFIFTVFVIFISLSVYGQTQDKYENISHISIGGTHTLLNNKIFGLENTSIPQMNISYGHDWNGPNYRFPLTFSLDFSSKIPHRREGGSDLEAYNKIDSRLSFSYLGNISKEKHFMGTRLNINSGADFFSVNNEVYSRYTRGYFETSLGLSYQYETQISDLPFSLNIDFPVIAALTNWGSFQAVLSDEPIEYVQKFAVKTVNQYLSPNLSLELDVLAKKSLRWSVVYNARHNMFRYYSNSLWLHTFQQTIGIRIYYNPDWDNSYTW